jgi:membrane-bound ClpP family serine protease
MMPTWITAALTAIDTTSSSVLFAVQNAVQETAPQTAQATVNEAILAIFLIVVAVVLLLLEILVVSYGLLAISALGFAIAGISIGFSASPVVGWILLAVTPILTFAVVSWGFKRLQRSPLVPKMAITDDAGYRHQSERLGITAESRGILVTDAMPTGRARFDNGEIDVQIEGPAALKGSHIKVRRIEGPSIIVVVDVENLGGTKS